MKFKLENFRKGIPDQEFLEDVKRVAKLINKNTVSISNYDKYGNFHSSTLSKRFGSWNNVLQRSGLELSEIKKNIPVNDLFKNIEDIWIKLGRQPRYLELKKPLSKHSASTYERRFGTWNKALKEFIEFINTDTDEYNINSNQTLVDLTDINSKKYQHSTRREISDRLRFKILMRDGFTCKSCGRSPIKERGVELQVDHILPWSKGGETIPENLETKCKECNQGKGNIIEI